MSELKSCPFCGGEAVLHPIYDMDTGAVDGWFAWCDNDTCESKPKTGWFITEAEAIEAWNTRAERTCENANADGYKYRFECSACGHSVIVHDCSTRLDELPNYCPNCGAKVVDHS